MSVYRITFINKNRDPHALGIRAITVNVEAPNSAQAGQDGLVQITGLVGSGFRERAETVCYPCGGCGREGGGGDMPCHYCWGSGKQLEDIG